MKRLLRCASVLLLCGAMICPVADARGRNDRGRDNRHTTQPASRPGNNGRPSHGNPGGHSERPVSKPRPDNQRPANQNHRPGGNQRPGNDYRPQRPPQVAHHPGPSRPMPPHNPWFRPAPPPKWHPSHSWRPFRSILGITFGSAINFSVNALINSGYTVSSYNNSSVYVNNVPMLNMLWPEAILFYNSPGGLCGSRFMYSTGYYDRNRYNSAYASLVSAYGPPVSMQNISGGMEATWWGTGNQFIRLSFAQQYNGYGALSYLTTLSFGI